MKSNGICFCYLYQNPKQVFIYSHAIYNVYFKIFGNGILEHKYYYLVIYILCQDGNLITKFKPPIVAIRILNIDRVSIYSIIPSEFLSQFQDLVGTAYLIEDMFNLIIGTNSGKKLYVLICQAHYY